MNYDKDYLQAGYLFNKMASQVAAGATFEKDAGIQEIWEWLQSMYDKVMGYFSGGKPKGDPAAIGHLADIAKAVRPLGSLESLGAKGVGPSQGPSQGPGQLFPGESSLDVGPGSQIPFLSAADREALNLAKMQAITAGPAAGPDTPGVSVESISPLEEKTMETPGQPSLKQWIKATMPAALRYAP
jgi:hypothetical protein